MADIFELDPDLRSYQGLLRDNEVDGVYVKENSNSRPLPAAPIEWKQEAVDAFWRAYSTVRQYPGNKNYFTPIVRGLHAAFEAQGLPCVPIWDGRQTSAFDKTHTESMLFFVGAPPSFYERVKYLATCDGLNAALALAQPNGVTFEDHQKWFRELDNRKSAEQNDQPKEHRSILQRFLTWFN